MTSTSAKIVNPRAVADALAPVQTAAEKLFWFLSRTAVRAPAVYKACRPGSMYLAAGVKVPKALGARVACEKIPLLAPPHTMIGLLVLRLPTTLIEAPDV